MVKKETRSKESPQCANDGGFTLIEVLIAMIIMAGAVLLLNNSWSGNYRRLEKARLNNTFALLLSRQMTEIEIKYKNKPVEEIEESDGGEYGKAYPGFSWEMKSQKFEMPDISGLLTARDGGAEGSLLTLVSQVTETITKSVKEVQVTIIYTPNNVKDAKPIKHSATTYFIDYSKDLPLSALGGALNGAGGN